jgi:hypothetical protein
VAGGHDQYTANGERVQVARGLIGAAPTFSDIVRDSTPADLLEMVRLHRKYVPNERMPAALQRAVGRAWIEHARGAS